jgi:GNAT superfamily N-acetyltransferase
MLLKKYNDTFSELIKEYQLTDEQLLFTGAPEVPLKISLTNPFIHPIVGIENNLLTNFFVLDERKDVALYTDNEHAVLLRTFSTDHRYQGKGYAKKTLRLLPDFTKKLFPTADEIILAVNKKNISAQTLYKKSGFVLMDKIVEGAAGPQYVMTLSLL